MDLPVYLAMTPGEFSCGHSAVPHPGWMSCHFSAYTTGLSGLPETLPEGSLLILDDATPMAGHDASRILDELGRFLEENPADGLLLDFQRLPTEDTLSLVEHLCALPCPVAAPEGYGRDVSCPLFLPPCPAYIPLEEYIEKYFGREIWLEAARSSHVLTLTEDGCKTEDTAFDRELLYGNARLCCHYDMVVEENRAIFYLERTRQDLEALLAQAQALGVKKAVGLYQELGV